MRRPWRLLPVRFIGSAIVFSFAAILFALAWKFGGLEFGPLGIALAIPLGFPVLVGWLSLLAGIHRGRTRFRLVLAGTAMLVLGVTCAAVWIGIHEAGQEAARQQAYDQLPER